MPVRAVHRQPVLLTLSHCAGLIDLKKRLTLMRNKGRYSLMIKRESCRVVVGDSPRWRLKGQARCRSGACGNGTFIKARA